jgi:membrane protein DedA with SNARE-associated domain
MLAELIARYGYLIVLVGTFFEGETVVVIAGYAAHRGHLSLLWVAVCAFAGSTCGDQLAYFLGRRYAPRVLRHREAWRPQIERVRSLLERHALKVMLGFRFLYGIRTVTPFTIGWAGIPPRTFLPLNIVGAVVWALSVSALGYAFGHALALALERAHRYEEWVMLSIAVVGAAAWLVRRHRRQRDAHGGDAPTNSAP